MSRHPAGRCRLSTTPAARAAARIANENSPSCASDPALTTAASEETPTSRSEPQISSDLASITPTTTTAISRRATAIQPTSASIPTQAKKTTTSPTRIAEISPRTWSAYGASAISIPAMKPPRAGDRSSTKQAPTAPSERMIELRASSSCCPRPAVVNRRRITTSSSTYIAATSPTSRASDALRSTTTEPAPKRRWRRPRPPGAGSTSRKADNREILGEQHSGRRQPVDAVRLRPILEQAHHDARCWIARSPWLPRSPRVVRGRALRAGARRAAVSAATCIAPATQSSPPPSRWILVQGKSSPIGEQQQRDADLAHERERRRVVHDAKRRPAHRAPDRPAGSPEACSAQPLEDQTEHQCHARHDVVQNGVLYLHAAGGEDHSLVLPTTGTATRMGGTSRSGHPAG